jgi:Txe/YoeB family toxin of toxin-antitoxin system
MIQFDKKRPDLYSLTVSVIEPLKYLGSGVWSRRITQEQRLVYVGGAERLDFIQARYHYE